MDEESQEPQSKISIVIWMVGFIVAIVFDVLSLIPLVGDIEEVPAGAVFVLNAIFGVQNAILIAQGAAMAIKAIPVVQWLPAWTGGVAFAWYIEHSSSKLASKIEEGAAIAGALEGEEGGLETEAEKASQAGAVTEEVGASAAGAEAAGAEGAAGAGAEAEEAGGAPERENARPSETSTERGGEGEEGARGGEEEEAAAEQEEGAKKEKEEESEKEMETKAQRPPEEGAMEADFGPSQEDEDSDEEDQLAA